MPDFWSGRRVLVTGGSGFLGRRVVALLRQRDADVAAPSSAGYDLTVPGSAEAMIAEHRPATIVHLAARVGGIGYNQAEPAPLYLANLLMGTHVIEAARHDRGVDKTVLLGTVCSYPKFTPVPFREESLWDGYPEETNAPYGLAKKAHLIHAQVNAAQYGQRFAYLIPTNLYGPGDKFHPAVSHVIPALIKKCVDAVESGDDKVDVWGTGRASREYLYVDDAAEAIVLAAQADSAAVPEPINLGTDHEVTIRETVETIARLVGFTGELRWDPAKPDGQPRRPRRRHPRRAAARMASAHAVRGRPAGDDRLVPGQPGRGGAGDPLRVALGPVLRSLRRAERERFSEERAGWAASVEPGTTPFQSSSTTEIVEPPGRGRHDPGGFGGGPVGRGEGVDGLVGVESARVRHDPELGVAQRFGPPAECRTGLAERVPKRRDAGDGDHPRPVFGDEATEALSAVAELARRQLGSPGRGPGDEVGDADATPDEVPAVCVAHPDASVDHPVDDAGESERRIETVARMGEVGRRGGRPQPRVDADEQQSKTGPDEVGHRRAAERLQLGPGETHGGAGYGRRCRDAHRLSAPHRASSGRAWPR